MTSASRDRTPTDKTPKNGKPSTGKPSAVRPSTVKPSTGKPSVGTSAAGTIGHIDELLAAVGMAHGRRATRKGLAGPRRGDKTYKDWPRTGKIRKSGGLELMQAPAWSEARERAWLRHAFSTRAGGASRIYQADVDAAAAEAEFSELRKVKNGDLNLSWTKEDDPARVAENRARFVAASLQIQRRKHATAADTGTAASRTAGATQLITLRQIHSGLIRVLSGETSRTGTGPSSTDSASTALATGLATALATPEGRAVLKGDGMMTDLPGLLLGIQTADCIPVLIADTKNKAVAAFHAGWRGTLSRIVERGVGRMRLEYGSRPKDLIAAIGPGIGPCCYSVGDEVKQEFESQFAYADALFSEVYDSDPIREKYPMLFLTQRAPGHSNIGPQTHLDLWEANLRQLLDAGIPRRNITVTGECTACHTGRYFSHRAERGFTGRMLNVIGIVPATPAARAK